MLRAIELVGQFGYYAMCIALALPSGLLHFSACARQLAIVVLGALPLGIAAGGSLGIVVWLHLRGSIVEVAGPGALQYMPQGLALAVVLELGPITAALLVAGRTGASLGAELSSMKLTEQLDALEMIGVSLLRKLVVPRVWGCMLALPVLAILIDYVALGAAYAAEAFGGSMTGAQFLNNCLAVLTLRTVIPATLKTIVFGFLVGTAGCFWGMAAEGGAEGVGQAATRGVVYSILLVLIADVGLVRAIQLLF